MSALPRKQNLWRHGSTRFEHPPMEDLVGAADGIFPMKVLLDADVGEEVRKFENVFSLDEALDLMVRACGPIPMVDFARAKGRFMEENSLDDLLKMP
jgi:hypothetical protein